MFIVDPEAKVRTILHYPLSTGRNFDEILRVVKALQTADEFNVSTPADWSPGEPAIVPTAGSCGVTEQRMAGAEADVACEDRLFCTRAIDEATIEQAICGNWPPEELPPRGPGPRGGSIISGPSPPLKGGPAMSDAPSIRHTPVPLFAAVMGVGGLALAWRRATFAWSLPDCPWLILLGVATILFVVIAEAYLIKLIRYPAAVIEDLHHPIRMNFVPTITISLLLLATGYAEIAPGVATVL